MEIVLTDMPEKLVGILTSDIAVKYKAAPCEVNSPLAGVPKGQRNDEMFRYGCRLVCQGLHPDEIRCLVNTKSDNCSLPLGNSELLATIQSLLSYSKQDELVGYDANDLLTQDYPEPEYVVPGILPVGLTVFAGDPKVGKSWLGLDMSVNVALGGKLFGKVDVEKGRVLCLVLEDTPNRLKDRIIKIIGDKQIPPNVLKFHTSWPVNGVAQLEAEIAAMPGLRLCIIDTLARFRSASKANSDLYGKDYNDIAALKAIADKYGIAMVVVHHLRKSKDSDPYKMISGTQGIAGAADTNWVMEKTSGKAAVNLHIRGRDIEDTLLSMEFEDFRWNIVGSFEVPPTAFELKIMKLIAAETKKPKEVADILGEDTAKVSKVLQRMVEKGLIMKPEYGSYIGL